MLNAVVGFAGLAATLWTLERGADLALANKERLVAAGTLALAAWSGEEGGSCPVDSEHSALPVSGRARAAEVESPGADRVRRPFRGRVPRSSPTCAS